VQSNPNDPSGADPHKLVEPANGFLLTADMDVQSLWIRLRR